MKILKNINDKFLLGIVTFGYIGLISKRMPGTIGSLAATLLCYLLHNNFKLFYVLSFTLFVVGVVTSQEYVTRYSNDKDPKFIVIDEAAAIFLGNAMLLQFLPYNYLLYLMNFIIFRFFDILKPYPINKIEQFFKTLPNYFGFGIMVDDILAVLFGTICSFLIFYF